jgi:hypothetical protein
MSATHAPQKRRFGKFTLSPVSRDDNVPASSWWVDLERDAFAQRVEIEKVRMGSSWFGFHLRDEHYLGRPGTNR